MGGVARALVWWVVVHGVVGLCGPPRWTGMFCTLGSWLHRQLVLRCVLRWQAQRARLQGDALYGDLQLRRR